MARIHIQLHSDGKDELTIQKVMQRLKNPKWNYVNLKQYLSLFTGENVTKIEHVFQCFSEEPDPKMDMLLVWASCEDGAYRLFCISVEETMTVVSE